MVIPTRLRIFFGELRRRHVFRVAGVYAVVAWVIVEVVSVVSPLLQLPDWTPTLVLVLLLVGFPIAVLFAWIFDITPAGVQRTEEISAPPDLAAAAREPTVVDGGATAEDRSTRLIVLPFRMLRPDPETEFLAFSLPDAVTSSLAGLRSLVVRSNLAALRFAGDTPDLAALASQADVVLTGTLLRVGPHLRVSCQLTDADDGRLVWSQSSQVSLGDLFELQDQLTHRIVDSLELPLSARERQILKRDVPASARAYEFYLRANQIAHEVGQWMTARDLYQRSLEEDPGYAPAWARLARCYRLIAKWSEAGSARQQNLEAAEVAFRRALELNPELAAAHSLYAQLEVDLGRARDAMVRLITRARAGSADAELYAGLVPACRFCGLLDASVAAHQRARQLDPTIATSVAHTYFMRGEYERVFEETFGDIGYIEPLALASLGRVEEAVATLRERERAAGKSTVQSYLVSLRAALQGDRRQSLEAHQHAVVNLLDAEALFYLARQLAFVGETERALAELGRAVDSGFHCLPAFQHDAWLEPLRADPRFAALVRRAEEEFNRSTEAFRAARGDEALLPPAPYAIPA